MGPNVIEPLNVAQLFTALGFDLTEDIDERVRWVLIELMLRREEGSES